MAIMLKTRTVYSVTYFTGRRVFDKTLGESVRETKTVDFDWEEDFAAFCAFLDICGKDLVSVDAVKIDDPWF